MKTICILIILLFVTGLSAQTVKKTLLLKKRWGKTIYRIREHRLVKVKDRNNNIYKGYMTIISNDSIALDSFKLALADIKRIAKVSYPRRVIGHGIAVMSLAVGAGGVNILHETGSGHGVLESFALLYAGIGMVTFGITMIPAGEMIAGVLPKCVYRHRKLVVKTRVLKH